MWHCIAQEERSSREEHGVVFVSTRTVLATPSKRGACANPAGSAAQGPPFKELVPHSILAKKPFAVWGGKPAERSVSSREVRPGEETRAQLSCWGMQTSNGLALWQVYGEGHWWQVSCHGGKQQPELITNYEEKSQRCNLFYFIFKFLSLYIHIWTNWGQKRKQFFLYPTQGTRVGTDTCQHKQYVLCYCLVVSSSRRDVARAMVWWNHGYKHKMTLTSVLRDMFILSTIYFLLIVICELVLCSSPKLPDFAACHPSVL